MATGRLAEQPPLKWEDGSAVTIVLAAEGYPGRPAKGRPITGLPEDTDEAYVLHAGTSLDEEGRLVSSGGRVLSAVGRGRDLGEARGRAYRALEPIELQGSFYRRDIGDKAAGIDLS